MLKRLLRKIRRRLTQKPYLQDPSRVGYWFDRVLGNKPVRVVQIGSNDGVTGDPIFPLFNKHPAWKGLLVEPLPYIFEKLKDNHPDKTQFSLANVAIGEVGILPFYYVDKAAKDALPDLPYWYDQLASFDRHHIVKELDGVLEPFIRTIEVESTDLPTLLSRYEIDQFDILHIDAEGYDWVVLQQLDLTAFSPTFILVEYHHLDADDQRAALSFLANRYTVFQVGIDWLAVESLTSGSTLNRMAKQFPAATVVTKKSY